MDASNDSDLAEALQGRGELLACLRLFCIRRRGHLLLALPRDAAAARATLGLYHPQAHLARVLIWVVRILVRFRLHPLLPKIELTVRDKSPLASMLDKPDSLGFLLGNPESASRRAVIVYRENDQLLVDKLGFRGAARESVLRELEHIKALPQGNAALPAVVSEDTGEQWASYATRYLNGKSPRKADDGKVLGVLKNWLENSQPALLSATGQWREMADHAASHDVGNLWKRLGKAADNQVQVGVFHGDFAPWNIKVSPDGSVHVMDWESGCPHGPAGWDWLHYMIQRATLVDHHGVAKVLDDCRRWANTSTGKAFLDAAGWGAHVEGWLGSYLMHSSWIGGFERQDLLAEWMQV